MNVVFMGTPEFAVPTLEKLYEEGYNVSLVITQPDRPKGRGKKLTPPPVKIKAEELGIKVFQPEKVNNIDSINKIKDLSPDFIVVVAYGQILKDDILNIPKYGCINVHASLLPFYRGAAPINWVVINGEEKTGITTMLMDKGLDAGDMLLKEEIIIGENDTASDIHDKLKEIGAKLLIKTLKGLEEGTIQPVPQDNSKATYAPMLDKNTGKIDFNKTANEIKNLVRGTTPWPGAYVEFEGSILKIFEVDICEKFKEGQPGMVVKVSEDGIFVNSKDKCVIIKEIQFPGKKRMKVKDYLSGNEFKENTILK